MQRVRFGTARNTRFWRKREREGRTARVLRSKKRKACEARGKGEGTPDLAVLMIVREEGKPALLL